MKQEFERFDWTYDFWEAERIDKFLVQELENSSRSQIQQWIKEGHILVNEQAVKTNYKLQWNDAITLRIPPPQEVHILPEPMNLDIAYEDTDVIVVNKPRGMVVHPAPGHYSGTLVNGLLAHCQDLSGINGVLRPGIVHRIDKDTSGLLVVAKNDQAHLALAEQLKAHSVTRQYIAIVHGQIPHAKGTIDAPIGRDPVHRQQMSIVAQGKKAVTHFQVIEHLHNYTLVQLNLETGRTHQIRVHMKYIGFPLVGDPKYGPASDFPIQGQALHAQTLGFKHPRSNQYLEFTTELPAEFQQLLRYLHQQA